jgi:hypothetical protein
MAPDVLHGTFIPVLLAALLCLSVDASLPAADFYVANGGDDGHAGSQAAPFGSVSYALSRAANGDTVYLQRGSVFREGGLTLNSGRRLTSYGNPSQPLPALAGSVLVTNFTPWPSDPRIYRAALTSTSTVEQVYVNGTMATLARYPDSGWLRTATGSGDNLIVDPALTNRVGAAPGRWTGAQARWRKWSWWYETRPITNDDGHGSLSLGDPTTIAGLIGIGSGFYIDNSLLELDAPGEWFWDSSAGMLYLYPPAGTSPTSMVVEAAVRDQAITVAGGTLERIALHQYTGTGVSLSSSSTVQGCVIEQIGDRGLYGGWSAYGSHVQYCTFRDILNVGIFWNENPAGAGGTIIERNRLDRIGTVPGLGGSGTWHAAGVIICNAQVTGNGIHFQYNRLTETGYAGIIVGSSRQTIERNVFRKCMATLNDGAAIYCNAHTNYISENIILDTIGDLDSSQPWTPLGHGIWPEFLSNFSGSEIIGNTVYGSGGNGLFLGNNFNCRISTNVFLGNRLAGMALGYGEPGLSDGLTNQNHVIQGNLIGLGAVPWSTTLPQTLETWALTNQHAALSFEVYTDRDLDFGTMSGTTFISTNGQGLIYDSNRNKFTISQWQAAESAWADPAPTNIIGAGYLFINDTESPVNFPLPSGVAWRTLQGAGVSNAVAIQPYRSVVLLATNAVPADLPAYFLATDYGIISYTNWMKVKGVFGTNTVSTADPDQDGLPNFAEYFYNLEPEAANPLPGLTCRYDSASGSFVVGRTQRRYIEGASGALQYSQRLLVWSNLTGYAETKTDVPQDTAVQSLETFIPVVPNDRLFIRFSVTQ